MKLPRSLSGNELSRLLRRHYGYELTRQRGSHLRLTTSILGTEHHVTVPRHEVLRVGTLASILSDVSEYLGTTPDEVRQRLFGRFQ